jgi:Flp pilus assembly pilin Flp
MKRGVTRLANHKGQSFIEYFVLALIVLLAVVAFFQDGFVQIQETVSDTFPGLCESIAGTGC